MLKHKKGFVFTLDATLALLVVAFLFLFLITTISIDNSVYYSNQQLFNIGNDFLSILGQSGVLERYVGGSESYVRSDLQNKTEILPVQYCANITVSVFRYQNGFQLDNSYNSTRTGCSYTGVTVKVKRPFVNFNQVRFGLAEMELWLR